MDTVALHGLAILLGVGLLAILHNHGTEGTLRAIGIICLKWANALQQRRAKVRAKHEDELADLVGKPVLKQKREAA